MSTGFRLMALALITVVSLVACTSTPPADQQKVEKIVVGYSAVAGAQALPALIKDAGIFESNGLDAELVYIEGGSPSVKAVIAGDVQFSQVTGVPAVEAHLNGAEVTIIIGVQNRLEFKMIVKGIEKPADLKGKKFGIMRLGDLTETAARYYIKQAGLEPEKDVALIQAGGQAQRVAAMEAGAIDGTIVAEPFLTRAKKRGYKEMGSAEGLEYQATTILVSQAFVRSRPETVKKFVKAWVDGIHFYKTNKEATMKSMANFLKLTDDPEAIEITYDAYGPEMPPVPYPSPKGVQAILDELSPKYEKVKTIKPEDVIDASFVKALDDSGYIKKLYEK